MIINEAAMRNSEYTPVVLSSLRVGSVGGDRHYFPQYVSSGFCYDADIYDTKFKEFQDRSSYYQVMVELEHPAQPESESSEDGWRKFISINMERVVAVIDRGSIEMVKVGDDLVEIRALAKSTKQILSVDLSIAVFGMRSKSINKYITTPRGSLEVRQVSGIITWDIIGLDYNKSHAPELEYKAMVNSLLLPVSDEVKVAAADVMDYVYPQWPYGPVKKGVARNWKEMVGEDVRDQWSTFSTKQQEALRDTFRNIAETFTAYDKEG